MQKQWIEQHQLGWNPWKVLPAGCFATHSEFIAQAQKSAQEMFKRIFEMKFLPPGRGLH